MSRARSFFMRAEVGGNRLRLGFGLGTPGAMGKGEEDVGLGERADEAAVAGVVEDGKALAVVAGEDFQ
jgi:hypothetical protein